MTQATKDTLTQPITGDSEKSDDSPKFMRYLTYAAIGLVALILLPLIIGLLVVLLNTNTTATAERFGMIVDVIIIIISLQVALIVVSLVVLTLQIARLVVLLQTETSPILDDAKKTAQTAKGTAEFVGKNMTNPIIEAKAFSAGAFVFLREVGGIRRAIRKNGKSKPSTESSNPEVNNGE